MLHAFPCLRRLPDAALGLRREDRRRRLSHRRWRRPHHARCADQARRAHHARRAHPARCRRASGLPPGLAFCSGNCVDLLNDVNNCGGCNARCIGSSVMCQRGACVGFASPAASSSATAPASTPASTCSLRRLRDAVHGPRRVVLQRRLLGQRVRRRPHPLPGRVRRHAERHAPLRRLRPPVPAGRRVLRRPLRGRARLPSADHALWRPLRRRLDGLQQLRRVRARVSCGRRAPPAGRCEAPRCPPPTTRCGSTCASLADNPVNCGRCGLTCRAGQRCVAGACSSTPMSGTPFLIQALTASNCRATEHNTATGDDRGGIAVGNGQVFYTGDEHGRLRPRHARPHGARRRDGLDGIFGVSIAGLSFTLGSNRAPLDEAHSRSSTPSSA